MAFRRPKLTIPTRIFLSFVLVLLAFGLVAGASLLQHRRTAMTLRLLHEGYLPLAIIVGDAKTTQAGFDSALDRVMAESDSAATRYWLDRGRRIRPGTMRNARARIDRALALDPPDDDRRVLEGMRADVDSVLAAYAEADATFDELFQALERGDDAQAALRLEDLRRHEHVIRRRVRLAWSSVQNRIALMSRQSAEQEQQSVFEIAVLALLALAAGLVVLWWSQRLLSPLPRLQRRVAAVATGDFAGRIEAAGDDEIGQLTVEFERMVDAVGARDRQLREAADSLRELQRMQEQIVASLRSAVLVIDGAGVVRSVNRATESILGVGRDRIGERIARADLLARLPGLEAAIEQVAAGGEPAALSAAPLAGEDERFVDVSVGRFGTDDAGPRRSVLVVADDVTEELRTKARLIHSERLAAIGRMAAHVTHEVRNPLSSIGLNVELLEEELAGKSESAQSLLRSIQREIDRLTGITEEYLRLARLPAPRLEPEDVGVIARDVARFVAREMELASIELSVDVEEGLPMVAADEPQIRQALLNLLRNARESMPEGGVVTLEARARGDGVALLVTDRGPGIPAERRPRIFDLFYSTKERGTGLGLSLTQQIVSAHGGTIGCDDGPEGGTVFTLWLPASTTVDEAAEE